MNVGNRTGQTAWQCLRLPFGSLQLLWTKYRHRSKNCCRAPTPSSRQHHPWHSFRYNCMINALSTALHKPLPSLISVSLHRHHVCNCWHKNYISHNDLLYKVHIPNSSGWQVVLMKSKAIWTFSCGCHINLLTFFLQDLLRRIISGLWHKCS